MLIQLKNVTGPRHLKVMLNYPCPSSLAIMNKSHAVHTSADRVLLHPLVRILSSLCGNAFNSWASTQRHLQPLTVPAVARAPWPAVIQPTVPWRQVMIVVSWCWEGTWNQTAVFGTQGHGTSVYRTKLCFSVVNVILVSKGNGPKLHSFCSLTQLGIWPPRDPLVGC